MGSAELFSGVWRGGRDPGLVRIDPAPQTTVSGNYILQLPIPCPSGSQLGIEIFKLTKADPVEVGTPRQHWAASPGYPKWG